MNGALRTREAPGMPIARRVAALDWTAIGQGLDEVGLSLTGVVLGPLECNTIADFFADDRRFRSTIDMTRYRFGKGRYRYFDRPLPESGRESRLGRLVGGDTSPRNGCCAVPESLPCGNR